MSSRMKLGPWSMAIALGASLVAALGGCAAQRSYEDGKELVKQDRTEEALVKFQAAIDADPRTFDYKMAYLQTRNRSGEQMVERADRLAEQGKWQDAEDLYRRTLRMDGGNERALAGLKSLDSARKKALALPPVPAVAQAEVQLSAVYRKPISLEFKDVAIRQIFESISRSSGLNFIFDKDVKTDQKTSIFLKNSTVESAVYFLLLTNQLEQQVVDANTVLVFPNTVSKLKEYQEMTVKSFLLNSADAKTVAASLKTLLKSKEVVVDEKLNMLILRDTPTGINLATKLINMHDVAEPEVMLEVEILEVKRTKLVELGIQWPGSLSLTPLSANGSGGGSVTAAAANGITLDDLGRQSPATLGAALSPVKINARQVDTNANLLANPRIRARNHEKAKVLIGERVPNITSTATSTGFVSESINYVDVGLTLNVEPTVYLDNTVAIKISLEVSNIVDQVKTAGGSVAYQIGTRTASTLLSLKDGETQVLAGLINDEDRRTATKIPGLGNIPILGKLFGSSLDDKQKTEIVLSITPHLVRNIQRHDLAQAEFLSGTESNFRRRPELVTLPVAGGAPVSQAPAVPALPTAAPRNVTPPAGTATSIHWLAPDKVTLGSNFVLQVDLQTDQAISELPLTLGFDGHVFEVLRVLEGDFLKQDDGPVEFTSAVEPTGKIILMGRRKGAVGASGLGSVAKVLFKAVQTTEGARFEVLTADMVAQEGERVSGTLPPAHTIQVSP